MPKFEITGPGGQKFQIDAPEGASEQDALAYAKRQFSAAPAPEPDPYRATARQEIDADRAKGIPIDAGLPKRILHGATLGASDELLAGMATPIEMYKRGTWNPAEGYRHAKAREDLLNEDAHKSQGILGTGAEIAGGLGSGLGLARAGVTLARPGMGFLARTGAMGGDAAAFGGTAGALDGGDSLSDRAMGALKGAGLGLGVGLAAPAAVAVARPVLAPLASAARAMVNPGGVAESQLARAVMDSRMAPHQVNAELSQAANEGQGAYTLADALGNSGQRLLGTVTRAPGPGRTAAVDFLDARQADQGRRLGYVLREGFDAPLTAAETEKRLAATRSTNAEANYAPVKSEQTPIDVSPAVAEANKRISPLAEPNGWVPTDLASRAPVEQQIGSIRDPIREALKEARSYLASDNLTVSNVERAFRAKTNIDQMIASATERGQGALVGELKPVRDALDAALARTSKPYAAARDAYKADSATVDAVDLGRTAAKGGRPEDNISTFRGLGGNMDRETAFRAGYADPLISQAQNGAFGVNKARPLTSPAIQMEMPVFASPGRADELARRLGRESQMFETRAQATGGSRTADNLADQEAMRVDPSVLGSLLHGNFLHAGGNLMRNAVTNLSGYTPAVRERLAEMLLQRGGPSNVESVVRRVTDENSRRAALASALSRGGLGGSTPLLAESQRNR